MIERLFKRLMKKRKRKEEALKRGHELYVGLSVFYSPPLGLRAILEDDLRVLLFLEQ